MRDSVIRARRNLRQSRIVIVEDLTPHAYSLLWTVKDDTSACKEAWSKNGKIFMRALNCKIVLVKTLSDLKDSDRRAQWSRPSGHLHSRQASSAPPGRGAYSRRDHSVDNRQRNGAVRIETDGSMTHF